MNRRTMSKDLWQCVLEYVELGMLLKLEGFPPVISLAVERVARSRIAQMVPSVVKQLELITYTKLHSQDVEICEWPPGIMQHNYCSVCHAPVSFNYSERYSCWTRECNANLCNRCFKVCNNCGYVHCPKHVNINNKCRECNKIPEITFFFVFVFWI